MTKVAITEQYLTDIANAIRTKTGVSGVTYYPAEMADAISTIASSGGITPSGTISISENGTYNVTNYASASVNVAGGGGGSTTITSLSVTPSESEQTFNSSSVDGYKPVIVGAISSTYIGSGITQRSSTDLTELNGTVTVPAGYYSSQATKSVDTMTLPTAVTASATSGYTSKATISRSTSDQYINIAPGYNSAGGYYKISAVADGVVTAPSSISGSSASLSYDTQYSTITLTKTISVTPSVTTAGYISSGTAGNSSVTLTATVNSILQTRTITPGTTNQTISSGTYVAGTQTISGDANLISSNIISGKSIFGVAGNVVIQNVYTGSSAPSSATGSNGDIYIQS